MHALVIVRVVAGEVTEVDVIRGADVSVVNNVVVRVAIVLRVPFIDVVIKTSTSGDVPVVVVGTLPVIDAGDTNVVTAVWVPSIVVDTTVPTSGELLAVGNGMLDDVEVRVVTAVWVPSIIVDTTV